jgi:predicted phosphohydrolase
MTKNVFKLGWATDIHMDHAIRNPIMVEIFVSQIKNKACDGLVVTGDISNAPLVVDHLQSLRRGLGTDFPIYFVCGNHDFYHGSISKTRQKLAKFCEADPQFVYLTTCVGFIPLTSDTALLGDDGWYDALYSPIENSSLLLNDFFLIKELAPLYRSSRFRQAYHEPNGPLHNKLKELSAQSAESVRRKATMAIEAGYKNLVIATHIPPFPQNSLYQGRISDEDWLPFFSSKFMGDVVLDLADQYPGFHFTVLCGHSHGEARFTASRANLECRTGPAEYGYPALADVLNIQ